MLTNPQLMYAVVTGDIVDFTKLEGSEQEELLTALRLSFERIRQVGGEREEIAFDVYRGDSFQGVLSNPQEALRAVLLIRSMLRAAQPKSSSIAWDARLAIGIGKVEKLSERPTEGDGEAYRRSGPALDEMSPKRRLALRSPWESVNEEYDVSLSLLDAVIAKWSPKQAETVVELIEGKSRKQIAKAYEISQAAITYRIQGAGWYAVNKLLERYRKLME